MASSSPVPLDYAVVVLITIGGFLMLFGIFVILRFRTYRPIKTKSVALTTLSSVGGLTWILATLVVNNHFPRRPNSLLSVCALWTFWLQACFGYSLWLNCLTLRLIILHRIFVLKRDRYKYSFLVLLPLLVPVIVVSSVASAKHVILFENWDCKFQNPESPYAYILASLLLLYFLLFLGFAFILRNAMAQYNEFRLILRGGIISLFLFLLSLVTLSTNTYEQVIGRCFLSASVATAVFYYFWARNGVVIYNALFYREEYERKFLADLQRSPSEHGRERFPDTFRNLQIRLKEIRDEVRQSQIRIYELENEVNALESQYGPLQ